MKALAVTAADHKFFALVSGTIASLRANSLPGALDIAVLDIGLLDWERAELGTEPQAYRRTRLGN